MKKDTQNKPKLCPVCGCDREWLYRAINQQHTAREFFRAGNILKLCKDCKSYIYRGR